MTRFYKTPQEKTLWSIPNGTLVALNTGLKLLQRRPILRIHSTQYYHTLYQGLLRSSFQ